MARVSLPWIAVLFCILSFTFLIIGTFSTPYITSIYLIRVDAKHIIGEAKGGWLQLGVFGVCGVIEDVFTANPPQIGGPNLAENCYFSGLGYSLFTSAPGSSDTAQHTMIAGHETRALVLLPIAAATTGLIWIFSLFSAGKPNGRGMVATVLFGFQMIFTWAGFGVTAFVVDRAQSGIAYRNYAPNGIETSSRLGATMFLILAGATCMTLAFTFYCIHTVRSSRTQGHHHHHHRAGLESATYGHVDYHTQDFTRVKTFESETWTNNMPPEYSPTNGSSNDRTMPSPSTTAYSHESMQEMKDAVVLSCAR